MNLKERDVTAGNKFIWLKNGGQWRDLTNMVMKRRFPSNMGNLISNANIGVSAGFLL
jgi:hypothetical protein